MSAHKKEEEHKDDDVAQQIVTNNNDNSESVAAVEKNGVPKRKKRRKRRRASSSEAAKDELDMCRTVQQRYGAKRKVQDDIKEAVFNPCTGEIFQPSSYARMMARSTEAHLNRMLQPEPPDDLVASNWLCAFCLKPSFADEQGELYGPYFVRLSSECQPPAELLLMMMNCQTKILVKSEPAEPNSSVTTSAVHRGHHSKGEPKANIATNSNSSNKMAKHKNSSLTRRCSATAKSGGVQGSLDIWLHGDCALWAPELFLVGGRLPTLQLHIQRYWEQKCLICSGVGATIPITYSQNNDPPLVSATPSISGSSKTVSDVVERRHFLHYKCALENGYRLNSLTYVCRPPL
ncbi:hypothetical protein niasHT_014233 [Heterodera trifolii]|uniref:Uncharacterized protein n=1 Tax=Heterodera trifolii TaxID=157864 RepID=A0ABD2KXE3_9BILA